MAARIRKQHQDETRARIQTSQLINRLQDQADGKVELTTMQMKAIEILLRKSLPDLSAVEHSGHVANKNIEEMSRDELASLIARSREIIERGGDGAGEAGSGEQQPTPVH